MARRFSPGDIGAAISLLTRLPAPGAAHNRGARAAWAWPIAGALVGLVAALVGQVALILGLPPAFAGGAALATLAFATGGLHHDGLSDTFDGLWGGSDPERRLDIMRDSRVGSYGVLAVVFVTGLSWVALSEIAAEGRLWLALPLAGAASRAAMSVTMAALPSARPDGLARMTGRPSMQKALAAVAVAGVICLVLSPLRLPAVVLATGLAALCLALVSRRKIGGQTGDVLGATQQLAEMAALAALAAS